jgi:neutral amino acid transport system permease protein
MLGLLAKVNPNMGWFMILPLFASGDFGELAISYGAIVGAFIIAIPFRKWGAGMSQTRGPLCDVITKFYSYIRSFG